MAATRWPWVLAVVGVLAVAGCARDSTTEGADEAPRGPYECQGVSLGAEQLATAPAAADVVRGPARAAILEGVLGGDLDAGWLVIEQTEDRVALLRQLDAPEDLGAGDVRTHERVVAERIFGASNVEEGAWMLVSAGTCTLQRVLAGLAGADLVLAREPEPDATSVDLLVTERACASGETSEGRVEVVRRDLTDEALSLVIGVRPRGGDQECPGNPASRLTVELDEPLAGRPVLDAGVLPPRAITTAADDPNET